MRALLLTIALISTLAITGCYAGFLFIRVPVLKEATPITHLTTAHRGNLHRSLPDNSLPALRQAMAANVPLLEVDVRRSTTGDLFLFHDGSASRSNSYAPSSLRGIPIAELTTEQRNSIFLNKERTITIPRLSDALSLIKESLSTLQLDLKGESDDLLLAVANEVVRMKAEQYVVIQVRQPTRVVMMREKFPAIRVLARCKDDEQLTAAINAGAQFVELEKWLSEPAIERAHAAKIPVLLNVASSSLDNEEMHNYFRSRGVDIIMTDYAAGW